MLSTALIVQPDCGIITETVFDGRWSSIKKLFNSWRTDTYFEIFSLRGRGVPAEYEDDSIIIEADGWQYPQTMSQGLFNVFGLPEIPGRGLVIGKNIGGDIWASAAMRAEEALRFFRMKSRVLN